MKSKNILNLFVFFLVLILFSPGCQEETVEQPGSDVTFNVTPYHAFVTLDNGTKPARGGVTIFRMLDGTYDYTVKRDGYVSKSGSVVVTGSPLELTVTLDTIFRSVTFNVTPKDAEITMNNQTIIATKGTAVFDGLAMGSYGYSISRNGYITLNGNVAIAMQEESVTIELEPEASGEFTDVRDNQTYRWIKIGNQVWMTENLRYLPSVNKVDDASAGEERFYVYGYDGTDVESAKAHTESVTGDWNGDDVDETVEKNIYETFGVLYNFAGANKVCPEGWHLPTDEELQELEIAMGIDAAEAAATGTNRGGVLAKNLASEYGWMVSTTPDAIGNNQAENNSSGFSATAGGGVRRENGTFDWFKEFFIWSATLEEGKTDKAWRRGLHPDKPGIARWSASIERGYYIRCVKD